MPPPSLACRRLSRPGKAPPPPRHRNTLVGYPIRRPSRIVTKYSLMLTTWGDIVCGTGTDPAAAVATGAARVHHAAHARLPVRQHHDHTRHSYDGSRTVKRQCTPKRRGGLVPLPPPQHHHLHPPPPPPHHCGAHLIADLELGHFGAHRVDNTGDLVTRHHWAAPTKRTIMNQTTCTPDESIYHDQNRA
jgi:hypothetical protein